MYIRTEEFPNVHFQSLFIFHDMSKSSHFDNCMALSQRHEIMWCDNPWVKLLVYLCIIVLHLSDTRLVYSSCYTELWLVVIHVWTV